VLTVPTWLRNYLKDKPEYGMGYQKVRAKLSTGTYETGYVLNGSSFFKPNELGSSIDILLAEIHARTEKSSLSIVDLDLIARPFESLRGVRKIRAMQFANARSAMYGMDEAVRASGAAKDAPITTTVDGEEFKRFSAYVDDIRITEERGLTPGTFATTAEDALNVKTGKEAVARYALENKKSANKRFTILPEEDTRLQRGIVQPAYGEPGGGVEVIFVDGTGDYTVTGPDILPEE
jgi:hypothetical protein